MTDARDAGDFQTDLRRLDALLQEAGALSDAGARALTRALVQAVLGLHAAGLARIFAHLRAAGDAGRAVLDACAQDDAVGGLLLLHDLHPSGLEERVLRALEQVRPALRAHGGGVELLGVDGGVVRLRLKGNCDGCPSSAATMRQTVEEAIFAHAPDAAAVEVEAPAARPAAENGRARVALPLV